MEVLSLRSLAKRKPSYLRNGYEVPKWIVLCETLIKEGWSVSLYASKSTFSKYVYVEKENVKYKVRFSNHKANWQKEVCGDSDIYVGVGNRGVITTTQVLDFLLKGVPLGVKR